VASVLPSGDIKYSKVLGGGEGDFHLMIAKSQEEIYKRMSDENLELKDCLKQLQKEIFDIVDFKSEIYMKRSKAEYQQYEFDSEEMLRADIEKIREELFNMPFEESGREIIGKFQQNFKKLKEFMERIDKEISLLSVFNQKEEVYDDPSNKFNGITSIQQLKGLLKNYEALVEG
jgi:hypothetical protein